VPVPNLGEAVDEVSLQRWLVKPGDLVRTDQFIVTAGMDKCDADLRSPRTGLVLSRPEEGDTVAIGGILMSILPLDDRESRG
jgi:2-oxoglutarate dehydrogenase E2 component (dihydrolipoamide succinyltransferase)